MHDQEKNMTRAKISFSTRIDPQLFKAFKRLAAKRGIPLQSLIEIAMDEMLEREKAAA